MYVAHIRVELIFSPWKGDVLADRRAGHLVTDEGTAPPLQAYETRVLLLNESVVAELRFELKTSGTWTQRADHCSTPRYEGRHNPASRE